MIDFIFAGILYLGIMFVIAFCLSFVTIGLTYTFARVVKYCAGWRRQPSLAFNK